jgi:rubrerythrin
MRKRRKQGPASGGTVKPLTAADVLDRLAQIELDGLEFYRGLQRGTQLDWVRELAEVMIEAEKRHYNRFVQYADKARASTDPADNALKELLPDEVVRLMSAKVFISGELGEKAGQNVDERKALRMAIKAEENTVLLLGQLRSYVPREQRLYINQVIKEEQQHQTRLESVYRKNFS